jgi:hypothetical protein
MANPVSGVKAQAAGAANKAASGVKNKLNQMKSMANNLKNLGNIGNVFNLGGLNLGGLTGMLGDASGVLSMSTPDALIPNLDGILTGAQRSMKIAENITKMVAKAKSIGDAKSGIPSGSSFSANAMNQINAAKTEAANKISQVATPGNLAKVSSGITSGIQTAVSGGGASLSQITNQVQNSIPSIQNVSGQFSQGIGQISAKAGGFSGITGKVSGVVGNIPMPTIGG